MPTIAAYPTDWTVNQVLTESALEAQFNHIRDGVNASCLFKDVISQTVSVGVTYTATQTFTPASGVGINVTTGGVTIVGNSTITGTLGGVTTLTVGTVTASTAVTVGGAAVTTGTGTSGKSTRWTGTGVVAAGSIDDGGTYVSHAAQPRATVSGAPGTAVAATTSADVVVSTELMDVGAFCSSGVFTLPASTGGMYLLAATVTLSSGSGTTATVQWLKNGAALGGITSVTIPASGALVVPVNLIADLSAADVVKVNVTNSGGANSLTIDRASASVAKIW